MSVSPGQSTANNWKTVYGSSTAVWGSWCILSFTGLTYKLGVITRRCLYGSALTACCIPVSTTASRQHLRSAACHQLVIPSHRFTIFGRRAFSVAGPMFWNSLPRNLRDPSHTAAFFGRSLKHFYCHSTSVHSASEAFATMRYINRCFTYLLTYLLLAYNVLSSRALATTTTSSCY